MEWELDSIKNRQVDEFIFLNEEDAQLARNEKQQVEYLEKHMDVSQTQSVRMLYEKINREKLFRTPVGLKYMLKLHRQLSEAGASEESVQPIRLLTEYDPRIKNQTETVKSRIIQTKRETLKRRLQMSIILNLLLVAAVIAMFVITLKSDHPNILNYERTLQDRYASWEQELTEREAVLREKELNEQSR